MISGVIKFNHLAFVDMEQEKVWSPNMMHWFLDVTLGGEVVQEVLFDGISCHSGVMNELLDMTL